MSKTELYLSRIIKYGLYAILLTPLAFWPKALFPFLTPKFILFQVLVEIVFAAWLILLLRKCGFTRILADLRGNYIVLALLLFLFVSIISAIFGVDFLRSFWGIGARMTGLFAELHFFAWFLVLVSTFRSGSTRIKADQRGSGNYPRESAENPHISASTYLNFSFFVSLIVAATAFYQNPKWALAFGYGIFNNPTFVAPYLTFHFFWGLYQTLNLKSQISISKKLFYGGGATFLLLVILFAQIRGAILGLLAGLFILGLGLIFTNIFSRRARILLSTFYFLLSISLVGLWFLRSNESVQKISPIRRVTSISLSETTVQTRLLAWQVALKGFGDKALFGVGPENFNFLFNANYDPRFLKFGGGGFGETWFDKPHNAFLEVLTETGIIGSLAYILIWFVAAAVLFKLFTPLEADRSEAVVAASLAGRLLTGFKSGQKFLSLILSSAFVAYFGAVFFSFDSFGSWFGLYLFLAFLASQNRDTNMQIRANDTNNANNKNASILFVSLVIISILVSLFYLNYSIWRANLLNAGALRTFYRDPSIGLVLFDKSFSYFSPYKDEYQLDMISSVAGAVQKNIKLPNWEEAINYMLEKADEIVRAHPKNAAYYTDLVKVYNILGMLGRDPEILAQAKSFGEKSLELSPGRQETLFYLTQTALLEGNNDTAVILAQQAVDADPTIGLSYWYFGLAYIANGQIQEGINEIKKALNLGYMPQNEKEKNIIKNLGL